MRPYGRVVEHVELLQGTCGLEDGREPVPGAAVRRPLRDLQAADVYDPRVDAVEAGDAPEQRRLSGAVRSDQACERSGSDRERDVVDRPDGTERLGDADQLAGDRFDWPSCDRSRGHEESGYLKLDVIT